MREYETVFIIDPACDESTVDKEIANVEEVISERHGKIIEVQRWGKRRLAYEIKRKKEGIYAFVRFKAGPSALQELSRRFKLNELILRHMIVMSQEAEREEEDSGSTEPGETASRESEDLLGS